MLYFIGVRVPLLFQSNKLGSAMVWSNSQCLCCGVGFGWGVWSTSGLQLLSGNNSSHTFYAWPVLTLKLVWHAHLKNNTDVKGRAYFILKNKNKPPNQPKKHKEGFCLFFFNTLWKNIYVSWPIWNTNIRKLIQYKSVKIIAEDHTHSFLKSARMGNTFSENRSMMFTSHFPYFLSLSSSILGILVLTPL